MPGQTSHTDEIRYGMLAKIKQAFLVFSHSETDNMFAIQLQINVMLAEMFHRLSRRLAEGMSGINADVIGYRRLELLNADIQILRRTARQMAGATSFRKKGITGKQAVFKPKTHAAGRVSGRKQTVQLHLPQRKPVTVFQCVQLRATKAGNFDLRPGHEHIRLGPLQQGGNQIDMIMVRMSQQDRPEIRFCPFKLLRDLI